MKRKRKSLSIQQQAGSIQDEVPIRHIDASRIGSELILPYRGYRIANHEDLSRSLLSTGLRSAVG